MISGRHTSTTSFADHLREFTRGRVALVDGLPVMGTKFNLGLVKTLISGAHLGRWNEHNMNGVPAPVTATIFQALRPENIDKLNLSDPALVDRTHVLSCLSLHGHTIGDGLFLDPSTDQARQAMLALLVQHAAANREPPDGPTSVTRLLRERHRASIGSVGRWLVDHLQVTGDGNEKILADEIMAALAEDIPPDAQAQFQGRTRREILALARDLIQGFPITRRVKRGGRLLSAYPGLRLLTTADIHPAGAALPADIEARRAAERDPSSPNSSGPQATQIQQPQIQQPQVQQPQVQQPGGSTMGDLSAMSSIERVLERHEDEIMEDWASLVPKSLAGVFRKVILSNGTRCIQVEWEFRGGGTLPGPCIDIDILADQYPDCDVRY